MKTDKRSAYVTRDSILQLLSDDEVAKVSNAETTEHLTAGDEYIDLEQLALGVRKATDDKIPAKNTLVKRAVHQDTWRKVIAQLAAP